MKISHLAAVASIAGALALAGPALADDDDDDGPRSPCPNGFILVFDVFNISGEDRNDNDLVCVKTTGSGDIFRDDRG